MKKNPKYSHKFNPTRLYRTQSPEKKLEEKLKTLLLDYIQVTDSLFSLEPERIPKSNFLSLEPFVYKFSLFLYNSITFSYPPYDSLLLYSQQVKSL